MKIPDIDTLMARAYRHYPRNIPGDAPSYFEAEETCRLQGVLQVCAENMGGERPITPHRRVPIDGEVQEVLYALRMWLPFAEKLQRAFPDRIVWDRAIPWNDPCYRCEVMQAGLVQGSQAPRESGTCILSALAPVYALYVYVSGSREIMKGRAKAEFRYSQLPSKYDDREAKMAALIEETFHFTRMTEDTLLLPVPDVVPYASNLAIGEAKLVDCLFTPHRL